MFADKSGVATVETSALDATNIDTAFQLLLTKIYEGMKVSPSTYSGTTHMHRKSN